MGVFQTPRRPAAHPDAAQRRVGSQGFPRRPTRAADRGPLRCGCDPRRARRRSVMNGLDRSTAKIRGEACDRLPFMPITMMFAADYAGIPYRRYATGGDALAGAQLRVAEEFGFDHVSVISDPAREVSDLGGAIEWFEDQPPALSGDDALLGDKAILKTLQ